MHPILFETKFFTIHTLSLFVAVSILIGAYAMIKLSVKNGLKLQFLSENAFTIILWALFGARTLNILFHYQTYFYEISFDAFFKLFAIWDKGLNIWGAILAGIISFYYITKDREQDFWKWMDVIIPSVIIALTISHLGTFFEGTNYGHETSLPWGVNFESPAIKYAVPIHPTQIYAFLYSSVIAISLILVSQTKKILNLKLSGFTGLLGVILYSLFRFLEEFLRGDDTIEIFNIRVPQILALILFIITGTFLYIRYNRPDLLSKRKK